MGETKGGNEIREEAKTSKKQPANPGNKRNRRHTPRKKKEEVIENELKQSESQGE